MSASWYVVTVLESEMILFGIYALAVVGFAIWFGYILRRWSWIPRKRHDRVFVERF